MTWNYRVFKFTDRSETSSFEIREVYYDEEGKPTGYTDGESAPLGMTLDELRSDLGWMLQALDKPVLEESDFPNTEEEDEDED